MLLDARDSQLVLIDYQPRLMPAIAHGDDVLQRAAVLSALAALCEVPMWGTEQSPERLGPMLEPLRSRCRRLLPKTAFNACDAGLVDWLRPRSAQPAGNARSLPRHLQKPAPPVRQTIVLAGCEAHVCVLQTALGLLEHEFDVWVVTDASGSRRERERDAAFDRIAAAGVELVTTEMVAFEWLRDARHPQFRAALALIK
ncbi:isochorismatase family protein [Tepidimonas charontis]|uniref:Isochorismatase family protein n=1 Tax=Tepidimonas charontis TaxID=2267262 RepID=A0A554X2L4_9BURK|nr:isochorismatase family protein [Tepidimonas charontis]TSE30068.1 Isochorismatase family protein [Tepidimonas charontis]